ncbi:hypothetical protein K493DRAFT_100637 [Basidiobolus meristosporus CBS 931.73]|uniref:Actin cytoskeleton-regulatory complex protein pan1 n=1 Tax=Basidiobolus meristosporus CBS 931.73 TaxID=1314790 RepID=A0A1Y1YRM9_9FUNG|nr:hypothetical protein K493DRAFT_100637 [Basidiobolus meristosporus CBS 931.73]|eukprot:ORY00683.1 hypothetical protein K493DRAFT_100637 [Basidiobolus meristosporus CBS 931.73]
MYNTGSNYGSGPSMGAMNQLQITSGSSGSMLQKLSFLSPGEQQKFEQLYKQSVPDPSQQLTGEAARDIFLRSKLDPEILAQIWSLADVNVSGTLTFAEFALAMYLINMKLTGQNVPTQLPNNLRQEIISAMQASSTGAPSTAYPGYSPSGPTIPGVTTPLGGPMSGMSTSSPQYNGQSQSKPSNPTRSQWAVTVEEKAKFDEIFKSLDNAHSGFLSGEKARQVFTESGLNKSDLAKIWGLADIHNQGKLNSDEFAVAMHLIYAKIGGKEIPKSLPMNLVPPSTKDLSDSVSSLKQMLKTNKSNSLLSSPIPGIPKMDFDLDSADLNAARKAVLQDEDIGYVSSNRRKVGSSPKPASPKISYSERLAKFDVIRKQIKEKKLELEKLSSKTMDSDATVPGNEAELAALKKKILDLQRSINEAPASNTLANGRSEYDPVGSGQERKQLEAEFNELTSELPNLTKKVQSLDEKIAELQLELFKITDAKLHKTAPSKTNLANLFPFKASGSGDSLSEADRLKQKAAEMLAQRMQALTKPNTSANDPSVAEAKKRLDAATDKINQEKRGNEQYIREIEASLRQSQNEIRDIIQRTTQSGGPTSATSLSREDYEREKRKWDSRFGLESETKQFLDELKKIESKPTSPAQSYSSSYSRPSFISSTGADTSSKASPTLSKPSPLASAKSKEEKDRIIKEEAERRLKERQAFFQAQLQKTKEQKQLSQAEKSSDYSAFGKSTTPEQKDGWKSSTASESTNVRKPSDSPQAPTSLSSSAVLSSPPSVSQSEEGLLGGYKTLWLNKPSSTKSEEPTPQSSVPSFISKSKNPFPLHRSPNLPLPRSQNHQTRAVARMRMTQNKKELSESVLKRPSAKREKDKRPTSASRRPSAKPQKQPERKPKIWSLAPSPNPTHRLSSAIPTTCFPDSLLAIAPQNPHTVPRTMNGTSSKSPPTPPPPPPSSTRSSGCLPR